MLANALMPVLLLVVCAQQGRCQLLLQQLLLEDLDRYVVRAAPVPWLIIQIPPYDRKGKDK
jgi:hypothetical protein